LGNLPFKNLQTKAKNGAIFWFFRVVLLLISLLTSCCSLLISYCSLLNRAIAEQVNRFMGVMNRFEAGVNRFMGVLNRLDELARSVNFPYFSMVIRPMIVPFNPRPKRIDSGVV